MEWGDRMHSIIFQYANEGMRGTRGTSSMRGTWGTRGMRGMGGTRGMRGTRV